MLARVTGVFKKTNRNMQLPLGRWGTIKNESDNDKNIQERIEKNATSGNHDHCGSELCTKKIKIKTKKNIIFKDEEMFPYIL